MCRARSSPCSPRAGWRRPRCRGRKFWKWIPVPSFPRKTCSWPVLPNFTAPIKSTSSAFKFLIRNETCFCYLNGWKWKASTIVNYDSSVAPHFCLFHNFPSAKTLWFDVASNITSVNQCLIDELHSFGMLKLLFYDIDTWSKLPTSMTIKQATRPRYELIVLQKFISFLTSSYYHKRGCKFPDGLLQFVRFNQIVGLEIGLDPPEGRFLLEAGNRKSRQRIGLRHGKQFREQPQFWLDDTKNWKSPLQRLKLLYKFYLRPLCPNHEMNK